MKPSRYGSYCNPIHQGMGGGVVSTGTNGGGLIKITSDNLIFNGSINFNGGDRGAINSPSGSDG